MSSLYETDFYAWTQETAKALLNRNPENLDWENISEEIESLGRSQKSALTSQMVRLVKYLLKWKYQSSRRFRSWEVTIANARFEIEKLIKDSPSFKSTLQDCVDENYYQAVKEAAIEMCMEKTDLPSKCPFTLQQILDEDYLP
ncbi:MAG: DUF29 domain-containing protein [Chroococcidiopsidaceae cyanobacterium CP_BM_ER_R8_30]|nr:DUF29 domain-containing protein [Chroococcidiopsidaceae cyanobacterium CP_BM_ER_R8_30]